ISADGVGVAVGNYGVATSTEDKGATNESSRKSSVEQSRSASNSQSLRQHAPGGPRNRTFSSTSSITNVSTRRMMNRR
ncbi:unnamed protein product, partial [Amoebophrya sp. A25]